LSAITNLFHQEFIVVQNKQLIARLRVQMCTVYVFNQSDIGLPGLSQETGRKTCQLSKN